MYFCIHKERVALINGQKKAKWLGASYSSSTSALAFVRSSLIKAFKCSVKV